MTAAWGGICCSKPVCVTISLRKATYTYGNIMERKAYTVNIPSEKYVREADYFGIVSGKKVDKFAESGLNPVNSTLVDAPYIEEFPMILECRVVHTYDIGLHTQFIGEVLDIKVADALLDENDMPDMKQVNPIVFAPETRNYYGVGDLLGKAFQLGKEVKK